MHLYNTLHRRKESFTPKVPGKVTLYVCGITAYDLCHIGHARSAVVFDILVRYLRHAGYSVLFLRNFTDIDDKIIRRAAEEGISPKEVAEKYIQTFYEDMDRLHILRADEEPKCTEHIPEMIALTEQLIARDKAYATDNGDVYFRVRRFDEYGRLSNRNVDEMRSGARIEPGEDKEDPLDFALWKAAKPGEPWWESPWGKGRPGWHLECSAMAAKYVALPLDIHGGGQDLIFPHHENEIAQTKAATGTDLSTVWMHNGFVQINSEKMSKSLGNFFTIREVLERFLPETVRYFLLSQHYRSPLDFSDEALEEAEKGLKRLYAALAQMREFLDRTKWSKASLPDSFAKELEDIDASWTRAMEDDLNTAGALGQVFTAVRLAGRVMEDKSLRKSEGARNFIQVVQDKLATWGSVLGILEQNPAGFLDELKACRAQRKGIDPAQVEDLMARRQEARRNKDFAAADAIRDELAALSVEVKDTPQGATWDVT